VIEVSSAVAVVWQFSARDHAVREVREKTALRVIAVSFFVLAV
jgi:ADP-ribose pyrophosphatase YjhB (NUDIX family)